MAIVLDHTIVPAHDKLASAKFFAEIFGLPCGDPYGPFVPVAINEHTTFDFDDRRNPVEVHHYAFHVSPDEFDAILAAFKPRDSSTAAVPTRTKICGLENSMAAVSSIFANSAVTCSRSERKRRRKTSQQCGDRTSKLTPRRGCRRHRCACPWCRGDRPRECRRVCKSAHLPASGRARQSPCRFRRRGRRRSG